MSHCIFPLQIHGFRSTHTPCLTHSSFPLPVISRVPALHRHEGVRGSSAEGWQPQKSIGSRLWENSERSASVRKPPHTEAGEPCKGEGE